MDKKVEVSMLLQIYGKLLTEKQYRVIDYYYNEDLSLSEIAENEEITRQGVRDIIKKGEKKLFEYEEKLLFMKKTINQEKLAQSILENLNKIQKESSDKKVSNILEEVKKEFIMPERNDSMRRVYGYLLNGRCIDKEVLNAFVQKGLIYEDAVYHNAVFVGYDEEGYRSEKFGFDGKVVQE